MATTTITMQSQDWMFNEQEVVGKQIGIGLASTIRHENAVDKEESLKSNVELITTVSSSSVHGKHLSKCIKLVTQEDQRPIINPLQTAELETTQETE
jgi:hypothetical protein